MEIRAVTVIGANGTMGCNISGIFASFGNAKVYMVCRELEKAKAAVVRAVKSVRADSIASRLIAADYSMLEDCVRESDLVFESVAEKLDAKKTVAQQIAAYAKPDTILATGTSGLSIQTLAEIYPEPLRSRFFGVHMFNPPYNLSLCELIATKYSDEKLQEELEEYLTDVLHRTTVRVKDAPAFLGNRIGFYFINLALQFAEKYKDNGGCDYIDAILGPFTGRSMAPIVTSDFVGLDVHKAIVDNVHDNAPDYAQAAFVLPEYVEKLICEGKLGRKSKGGLYKQVVRDNGFKRIAVYDIASGVYRDVYKYSFPFAEDMKRAFHSGNYQKAFRVLVENRSLEAEICLKFLLQYVVYSLYAAHEIAYNVHAADQVLAAGFNWCPPLAMKDALSTVADFRALVHERLDAEMLEAIDVDSLLEYAEASYYDYRPYFRSV